MDLSEAHSSPLLERDLRLLVQTSLEYRVLRILLSVLASRLTQPLDLAEVARSARISVPALRRLLSSLEAMFEGRWPRRRKERLRRRRGVRPPAPIRDRALESRRKRVFTDERLRADADLQDVISINLERAVQLSVDIAAVVISHSQAAVPTTMAECFDTLLALRWVDSETALRMRKAVGRSCIGSRLSTSTTSGASPRRWWQRPRADQGIPVSRQKSMKGRTVIRPEENFRSPRCTW